MSDIYPQLSMEYKFEFMRNDLNATALIVSTDSHRRNWDRMHDWLRDSAHRVTLLKADVDARITTLERELTAANATIAACKAAGFIDAEGRVRKVLGTLPLTADNCIAGFPPGTGGLWYKMPSGHVMQTDPRRMVYEQSSRCVLTWLAGYGDVLVSACYSTPAAAREAQ